MKHAELIARLEAAEVGVGCEAREVCSLPPIHDQLEGATGRFYRRFCIAILKALEVKQCD